MFVETGNSAIPVLALSTGRLVEWYVTTGQYVEHGDVICRLRLPDETYSSVCAVASGTFRPTLSRHSIVYRMGVIGYIRDSVPPPLPHALLKVAVRLTVSQNLEIERLLTHLERAGTPVTKAQLIRELINEGLGIYASGTT